MDFVAENQPVDRLHNSSTARTFERDRASVGGVDGIKILNSDLERCDRGRGASVHSDAIDGTSLSGIEAAAGEDNRLAVWGKTGRPLIEIAFCKKQALVTAVGVHQPELAPEIVECASVEHELLAI